MKNIISAILFSFLAVGGSSVLTFAQPAAPAAKLPTNLLSATAKKMDPPIPDPNCTSCPGQPCKKATN